MVGKSESLPIMMPISGLAMVSVPPGDENSLLYQAQKQNMRFLLWTEFKKPAAVVSGERNVIRFNPLGPFTELNPDSHP